MFRAILHPSRVLHAGLFSTSSLSSAAFHNEAASETAVNSNTASTAAASLWLQNSNLNDSAAVAMHTQQADATGATATATAQDHGSALVELGDCNDSGSTDCMDYFVGGFVPRHLAEVAVAPESAGLKAHRSRSHAQKTDAAAASADTSLSSAAATASLSLRAGGDDGAVARRPVITKARRIRLASAASQAAEVLQAVGSPATALLLCQRVQQLQAEEALLNASLQRLKAERDLATVRHTCGEELDNYRRGVQQREQLVVRAAMNGDAHSEDAVISYSQESGGVAGGDTLPTVAEADLLGMSATADAEAAAAAAGKSVQRSGRASHTAAAAISAKKRLRIGATAAGVRTANAPPKSLSRGRVKPEAPKAKRPSSAKQEIAKARAAKQRKTPTVGRKHSAKAKAKAPPRMQAKTPVGVAKTAAAKIAKKLKSVKAKTSASAAATAHGRAHGQRPKITSAAMKLSRRRSVPAPPATNAKSKTAKAVAKMMSRKRR